MNNLDVYCVTDKKMNFLENTLLKLVGVGKENFSNNYMKCNTKDNIYYKEKHYSELTFHYWYWKNILPNENKDWIGFCQKRRFWTKTEEKKDVVTKDNLNDFLLSNIEKKNDIYESFICKHNKDIRSKKN